MKTLRAGIEIETVGQGRELLWGARDVQWTRLFVCGSLRNGEDKHPVVVGVRFVGEAVARGFELFAVGPHPAMVPGSGRVLGEVYEVSARHLRRLDHSEGHPRLYQRTPIVLEDGTKAEAYLMHPEQVSGRPRIESGDWTAYRDEQSG